MTLRGSDATGSDGDQGDALNQTMKPASPWTWKIRGDDVSVTWKDLPANLDNGP